MEEMDIGFIAVILCNQTMKESIIFTKMSAELKNYKDPNKWSKGQM